MDNSSIPFPDEAAHLEDMNKKLEYALERAEKDVEKRTGSIRLPSGIWRRTGVKSIPMKCFRMSFF